MVDAAQVNRGILISRQKAQNQDLMKSANELADSLIKKYLNETDAAFIMKKLERSLTCIVETYEKLDASEAVGGGHFFSMRDFFFCVKNFVCSAFVPLSRDSGRVDHANFHVSNDLVVRSVIRNFGGHGCAQQTIRESVAQLLELDENAVLQCSPLDLIIENINDSAKELSIHIGRHLMILNRSLIGLQLLNRHVRHQIPNGTGWHVLFGSCFPGDLKILAVTRKLRQVEQAIRTGGVLVLCHADQLFESLYMVNYSRLQQFNYNIDY